MATFSRVQHQSADGANPTATFGSTPTQGNLLVAIAFSRSGTAATSHSISGSGWTKRVERSTELSNIDARRSLSIWTKTAGASEPSAIQVSGDTVRLVIQEFTSGDTSLAWTHEATASNDNGTSWDPPCATGTTASVPAGALLLIGCAGWRNSSNSPGNLTGVAWSSANLGDNILYNGGQFNRSVASAFLQDSAAGTKASTVSWTDNDEQGCSAALLVFSVPAVDYEQEGYRFRADDGSETAATWLAAQDTPIVRGKNLNTRLRVLIDSVGDAPSQNYTLQVRRADASESWAAVGADLAFPVPSIVEIGNLAESTSTTVSPSWSSAVEEGDLLIVVATHTNQLTRSLSLGSGWTTESGAQITGSSSTGGDPRSIWGWKIASSADSAGGSVTVTRSGTGTTEALIARVIALRGVHPSAPIHAWNGSNQVTAAPQTHAIATTVANCRLIGLICEGDDDLLSGADTPWTIEDQDGTATGADALIAVLTATQAAAANPVPTTTLSKSGTDGINVYTIAVAPPAALPARFAMAASTHITDGAATTAQLAAPSGKTTADFTAGKIVDVTVDPAVDIAADRYTEIEWCVLATDAAADGEDYEFRVLIGGNPAQTLTVTPSWTVGAAAGGARSWGAIVG